MTAQTKGLSTVTLINWNKLTLNEKTKNQCFSHLMKKIKETAHQVTTRENISLLFPNP